LDENTRLYFEAKLKPAQGREWEVTIIGAKNANNVIKIGNRSFLRSDNGRLYDIKALKDSAAQWEGVKVFDNHLTQEEFERKQGMRSPANEWLGTIVKPRWHAGKNQLRGIFKVVEERLAAKLKSAWEQGVLNTVGLSIDTFPILGADEFVEGERLPVIEGFKKILSVDLVGDPAAGGGFNRLIAAQLREKSTMDDEATPEVITRDDIGQMVSDAVAAALAAQATEAEEVDSLSNEEVQEELDERELSQAELELQKVERKAKEARRETDLARTELMIERKLERAKLPEAFETAIRDQFAGRIVKAEDVDAAIKNLKEAQASLDPTGRVKAGGAHEIVMGIDDSDRMELEFSRLMMGNQAFRQLEHAEDESVKERIADSAAYGSWLKAGKPDLPQYPRISSLLWDYFGGDPILNNRAMEAATTSTLTTVVKNTVNIMTANDYAKREMWWEPIVSTEEVDTIDDSTLARVARRRGLY
jgi:hypothetical protein